MRLRLPLVAAMVLPLISTLVACGDDDDANGGKPGTTTASPLVCLPAPAPQKPAASCDVTIELPPLVAVRHLPEGTKITYCSNPPSSGEHYPTWAAFQEYNKPIEWPYLVHDMEHGAVVLLYKCDASCSEVVEALRKVRDQIPTDPLCDPSTPRRIIIAPSPDNPTIKTKVAAAAWGATYQSDCVDAPSLEAFIRDHYAKGPENFCVPGRVF